jgi:hypothetical protein
MTFRTRVANMDLIAVQGETEAPSRFLFAEPEWRSDVKSLGFIVEGRKAWEVLVHTALAHGYWEPPMVPVDEKDVVRYVNEVGVIPRPPESV